MFLSLGLKELAIKVTNDPDHKFDLSLQLDDLDTALDITRTVPELEAEPKWKAIGDKALAVWRFDLARECFEKSGDLSALMLLLLSIGDRNGLKKLANDAGGRTLSFVSRTNSTDTIPVEKGQNNLAFATLFQLGDTKSCVDLLVRTQRIPEAAIFARTYAPRCGFIDPQQMPHHPLRCLGFQFSTEGCRNLARRPYFKEPSKIGCKDRRSERSARCFHGGVGRGFGSRAFVGIGWRFS